VVSAGAVPARRQLLTHHLPAVLWLAAMTVALAVPADRADLPGWWPRLLHFHALDKVIHGLLFLVAALLLARSLRCLSALRWPLLTALLLLVAYGAATELAQHLFTDRRGEAMDVAADVGGATAGVLLLAARRSVGGGPGAAR
jgi:hypothetical protein